MRTRAYRPEILGCLEDRSLLSGVARLTADPVVLTRRQFHFIAEHMRLGFQSFARNRDVSQLHNEINDVAVWIPFGRVDGLQESINQIVNTMQHDLAANVPHGIRNERNRFHRRVHLQVVDAPRLERISARIAPDIAAHASMLAELKGGQVRRLPSLIDEHQFVLGTIKRPPCRHWS